MINWINVSENAIGNGISDIIIGAFITFIVTKYFEILNSKNRTIGALTLIKCEIETNKHILEDLLHNGILGFEIEMKRGTQEEVPIPYKVFSDAAKFLRTTSDSLLNDAFKSYFIELGLLKNTKLAEKIINLYMVIYHYRFQTAMRMEQLNWPLIDLMKSKIPENIQFSNETLALIDAELKTQRSIKVLHKVFCRNHD